MIIQAPTPQRAPVLRRLERVSHGAVHVYFLRSHDLGRGWGDVDVGSACFLRLPGGARRFIRDLLSPDLDVVCLFGYRGRQRLLAILIARLRRIPLILRSDSSARDEEERPRWRRQLKRIYLRLLLGNPEVWTIGTSNARYWSVLGFHRQVRIPYVVPVPPARSPDEATLSRIAIDNDFVVGYIGRLDPAKGAEDLIRAWANFRTTTPAAAPAVALVICGAGDLDGYIRDYAISDNSCQPLGPLSHAELGSVYAHCDVVVVPSRGPEAWGLVVNEALSYGARVIASDRVPAADDLVNANNGRRFPAGDVPALVASLRAEYERGRSRIVTAPPPDVAAMMAERLVAHHH